MNTNPHTLRGVLCATLGGVCWGLSGTGSQYLFSHFNAAPVELVCVRLLSAGLVLTAYALAVRRRQVAELCRNGRAFCRMAVFGILGIALCQFAYMTGIACSNAATTTVLQNLSLVFVMLLTCLRQRSRPTRTELISLLLALLGTYLLATGGDPRHMALSARALFWGVATAVGVTVYTVLPRTLLTRWGWEAVMGPATLLSAAAFNLAARSWTMRIDLPPSGWLTMGGITLFGSLLAFPLFMQGLADIGPVRTAMLAVMEPLVATVCSAAFLGTRFSPADLTGFACILSTIFLLARPAAKTAPPAGQGSAPAGGLSG